MDVTFFPRKDLEAKICDYKHGKRFAIQQNTDAGVNPYAPFQLFQAFVYGLKYTMFSNKYNPGGGASISNIDYINHANTGLLDLQHYFSTDRWVNPNTEEDEIIPDYYATSWTASGVNAFGVTLGEAKATRFPNHGQELYDISAGQFGFDVANGVPGTSNLSELIGIKLAQDEWINGLELPKNSTFSYRNGRNMSPEVYKNLYLGGRNSVRDVEYFYYGTSKVDGAPLGNFLPLSRTRTVNQPETTRWVDSYISTSQGAQERANQQVRDKIDEAYANRGAYCDFSHHHSAGSTNMLEDLFKTIGEHLDLEGYRDDCWIAGYGELIEYFWFRELTKRAAATIIHSKVYITLEWENLKTVEDGISDGLLLGMLNTPLSIEIDLTGTPLAGKQITSTGGKILSLGGNKYIIEFPFRDAVEGIKSVVIEEGIGDYYPTTPLAYTKSISGSEVTITSTIDTKAVLFSTTTDIYSINATLFSNIKKKVHKFSFDSIKTNYIGVVDELGRTNLITV